MVLVWMAAGSNSVNQLDKRPETMVTEKIIFHQNKQATSFYFVFVKSVYMLYIVFVVLNYMHTISITSIITAFDLGLMYYCVLDLEVVNTCCG